MNVEENLLMGAYVKRVRSKLREQMDFVFHLFPRLEERKGQQAQTQRKRAADARCRSRPDGRPQTPHAGTSLLLGWLPKW